MKKFVITIQGGNFWSKGYLRKIYYVDINADIDYTLTFTTRRI